MASKTNTKKATKRTKKVQERIPADWLPRHTLEQVTGVAKLLDEAFAGQPTPLSQLAKSLRMTPQSSQFRQLISSALGYGIVNKERANSLTLSEIGRKIVAPRLENEAEEGLRRAALNPLIPSLVYSDYNGHPLPSNEYFPVVLSEKYGVPKNRIAQGIKVIVDNARLAGLVQGISSTGQYIVNATGEPSAALTEPNSDARAQGYRQITDAGVDWLKTCFHITPIGEENSEQRKHADMMLENLLRPVLKDFGFTAIRADHIERSGLINQQILEYLVRARLCVADLSFNNPNAFYELGVRHVCKLPTIQIIRKGDKIPFDVAQGRTITIDTSDVYTMVGRLESAKRELAEHIRGFQSSNYQGSGNDNPIHVYLPGLKVLLGK
jgi:hypothetical protein